MPTTDLKSRYRAYIDCLNRRDWSSLSEHVDAAIHYNGQHVGLAGYRAMLEEDVRAIPDLHFHIELLVADPPHIAARLHFECTPTGELFGLPVNGKRVIFSENVFYEYRDGLISNVRSIIDKAAITSQLE
ncbi:ester cyclase [Pseudomonas matsuisoli]|uniref:Ester cyclase n=1 Tax=Pseudomonas matsuisoli TaxID=1515666 RepID=A0A917PXX1_9PSED|nr:ester cyclase [Pseudomonas matsuisoli]GGJ97976.1 ester cyclase [Pseudomonas matsuisoli]